MMAMLVLKKGVVERFTADKNTSKIDCVKASARHHPREPTGVQGHRADGPGRFGGPPPSRPALRLGAPSSAKQGFSLKTVAGGIIQPTALSAGGTLSASAGKMQSQTMCWTLTTAELFQGSPQKQQGPRDRSLPNTRCIIARYLRHEYFFQSTVPYCANQGS